MKNYYKILGIKRDATQKQVKHAFREKAQQYHPDRNGSAGAQDKFREINEAYQTLGNETKRNIYNYDLKQSEGRSSTGPRPSRPSASSEQTYRRPEEYHYGSKPKRKKKFTIVLPHWARPIVSALQLLAEVIFGAALGVGIVYSKNTYMGTLEILPLVQTIIAGVMGGLAAICLTGENDLEQQLKSKLKDGFILIRSLGAVLSGAFFGGVVAEVLQFTYETDLQFTIRVGMMAGSFLFGLMSNVEHLWTRLRTPGARFEALFATVRAFVIASIIAAIMLLTSYMLSIFELSTFSWDGAFYGFVIGTVLGTMEPSDLLAYSRYASAYVGKMIVLLLVMLALVIGVFLGQYLKAEDIFTIF